MKILVTGAQGFVGAALCRRLAASGHAVTGLVRTEPTAAAAPGWMRLVAVGDFEAVADFRPFADGTDAIVHLAARVHMMRETADDPAAAYRRANVDVTRRLAEAAEAAGTERFVFLSSVKVNGEATTGKPFDENDPPTPQDPYGVSKLEAERALAAFANITILRTPLIYGPGVRANFASLMRLCDSCLPLPLDGITENRRSLLYLGNLTHAIERVLTVFGAASPPVVAGPFLLSDGEDLSTAGLVRRLRASFNRRTLPLPVPAGLLRSLAALAGRSAAADRLCGSLQVDSRRFREAFDWSPPFTVDQGIAATAAARRAAP